MKLNKDTIPQYLKDLVEEYSPDFYYISYIPEFKYSYVSEYALENFGLDPDKLYEKEGIYYSLSVIHADDAQISLSNYLELLETCSRPDYDKTKITAFTTEYRMKNTKGEFVWVESRDYVYSYTPEGKVELILGMATNIQARKRREELMMSNLNLESIVGGIHSVYSQKRKVLEKLSPREHDVVKLLSQGLSSKMIAEKLYISPETAETHRKNILRKLEVKNTAELLNVLLQQKRFL